MFLDGDTEMRMAERSVLQQMLRLLSSGGIHTMDEAARRLGVSQGLVEAMAEDLARRGYLAALNTGCGMSCAGCGAADSCGITASASSSRLLALTAAGRAAAERD